MELFHVPWKYTLIKHGLAGGNCDDPTFRQLQVTFIKATFNQIYLTLISNTKTRLVILHEQFCRFPPLHKEYRTSTAKECPALTVLLFTCT